jgi:hypothetical protein
MRVAGRKPFGYRVNRRAIVRNGERVPETIVGRRSLPQTRRGANFRKTPDPQVVLVVDDAKK